MLPVDVNIHRDRGVSTGSGDIQVAGVSAGSGHTRRASVKRAFSRCRESNHTERGEQPLEASSHIVGLREGLFLTPMPYSVNWTSTSFTSQRGSIFSMISSFIAGANW